MVLTEFDFADLRRLDRAKLFVGTTRAQLALEVVLSRRVEAALSALVSA